MNEKASIKVFFNSACPVCDAGIQGQKKKMESCAVEWQDVHIDNELVKHLDADLEFVRERLHVIDENGNLCIGYEAFIAIWRSSPDEQWKATLSSIPVFRQALNILYNLCAKFLYQRNKSKNHW